eukprot:gene1424-15846_t
MLSLMNLFAVAMLGAAAVTTERPAESVFLFVDPGVVTEVEVGRSEGGWIAAVQPATKESKAPLMDESEIWEVRWDNTYATTTWDAIKKVFRMWYGSNLSCGSTTKSRPTDSKPNPESGCGHPTWHQQHPGQEPWRTDQTISAILYAESADGLSWEKPAMNLITYGAPPPPPPPCVVGSLGGGDEKVANMTIEQCPNPNGTDIFEFHFQDAYGSKRLNPKAKAWRSWLWVPRGTGGVVNHTNVLVSGTGGTGIVYDMQDKNASRRYKMFGGMHWEMTGRFTTPNMLTNFTPAVQVFNGTADYQIYMNPNRTMFYYSGGDGPHDGQRDDSIGLAYATTHAYAGLKRTDGGVDASVKSSLKTTPLLPFHGKGYDNSTRVRWHLLASIGSNDGEKGAAEQARSGRSAPSLRARTLQKGATESTAYIDVPLVANGAAQWVEIAASGSMPHAEPVVWEFECVGECTLFALKGKVEGKVQFTLAERISTLKCIERSFALATSPPGAPATLDAASPRQAVAVNDTYMTDEPAAPADQYLTVNYNGAAESNVADAEYLSVATGVTSSVAADNDTASEEFDLEEDSDGGIDL